MVGMSSKKHPFNFNFNFGNKEKSHGAKSGEYGTNLISGQKLTINEL